MSSHYLSSEYENLTILCTDSEVRLTLYIITGISLSRALDDFIHTLKSFGVRLKLFSFVAKRAAKRAHVMDLQSPSRE